MVVEVLEAAWLVLLLVNGCGGGVEECLWPTIWSAVTKYWWGMGIGEGCLGVCDPLFDFL